MQLAKCVEEDVEYTFCVMIATVMSKVMIAEIIQLPARRSA